MSVVSDCNRQFHNSDGTAIGVIVHFKGPTVHPHDKLASEEETHSGSTDLGGHVRFVEPPSNIFGKPGSSDAFSSRFANAARTAVATTVTGTSSSAWSI